MLFHLVMLACLAPAASSGNHCTNPLPGSQQLFQGVDLSMLDMYNQRPAFKLRIIPMTCANGNQRVIYSGCKATTYQFPDQIAYHIPSHEGRLKSSSRVIETMSDITNSFSVGVEVSGGYGPVTGSSSMSYSTMQHDIAENKYFYSTMEYKINTAKMHLKEPNSKEVNMADGPVQMADGPVQMADGPVRYLKSISGSMTDKRELYQTFIKKYGTHYFSAGEFGGVVRAVFKTKSALSKKFSKVNLAVAAGLAFESLIGSARVKVETKTKKSTASKDFNKSTTSSKEYYGGDHSLVDDGIVKWHPTVRAHPYLRGGTLSKISDLIVWDGNLKKQMEIAVEVYYRVQFKTSILKAIQKSLLNVCSDHYLSIPMKTFAADLESGVYNSSSLEDIQKSYDEVLLQYGYNTACDNTAQCTFDNSECVSQVCKCNKEHKYNPKTGHCVRECNNFGDDFTVYKSIWIKGHNIESFSKIKTMPNCIAKCFAGSYITRSIDFNARGQWCYCSTMSPGMEGVAVNAADGVYDVVLAVRQCNGTVPKASPRCN